MTFAFAAEGWDLDRLRSRSPWSQAAGVVVDLLMLPHDLAMRAIPNEWRIHNLWTTPLLLVLNHLLWGAALYALWRGHRTLRSRAPRARHPA